MSKNDTLATNYMSVAERFADAVNVGVFHGKRIISPGQIVESASASKIVLKNKKNTKIDVGQMYRDVVKKVIYDMNFCIIGVENQNEIHYVFPIRSMLYDAVTYKKQWNEIKREHKKKKDLEGAEFLSGFSKQDKLHAVVTLIVYFGSEPWDGAKDIHSLIDWAGMPEEFKEAVPNYPIYLLELNQYENLDDFQSDLKTVCRFLQNSNDAQKLEKMLEEHHEEFEDMEEDTYDLIGTLGNMKQVKEVKNRCKKKNGGHDMCKAIDDMMEARRCEGVKALVETCKEFGLSRVDVLLKVKDKFALSEESAEGYLKKYWK